MDASHRGTLIASAAELGYGPGAFRPLDDGEAAELATAVEDRFGNAANGAMAGWWHCERPCPVPTASRCFRDGGWHHLTGVAPDPTAPVWLLAENWGGRGPRLFAFASTVGVVQAVLGNTHGFEYIVVGQQLDWLFAEDHHDCVTVAGAEVFKRLEAIGAEPFAAPDSG